MRHHRIFTSILVAATLALTGCQGIATVGQAISAASPNAVAPAITLVCANATCSRAAHPVSAQLNSQGAYMVLPARPFFYVEATYPDLLALAVSVNNTPLPLLTGGSLDQCHPAGCAFYTTVSVPPTPPSTQPTSQTRAKISIVPPDAIAGQEAFAVTVGTRSLNTNHPSASSVSFKVAVIPPGMPSNVFATYSPRAGGVGGIFVGWTAPQGSPVDYYQVNRNDGVNTSFFGDPAHQEFLDTNVQAGMTYTYAVQARNQSGIGPVSNSASASVPQATTASGAPTETCDNKTPSSSAANFVIAVENPNTKCLTNTVAVFANNQTDAKNCVKAAAVPNAVIGLASQLAIHLFSVYLPDGNGGYTCSTFIDYGLSASDAKACVTYSCSNCTIHDITSNVYSNGQISADYQNWCDDHPSP